MTDTTKSMRTLAARDGHAVTWSDTKPPKLQLLRCRHDDDLAGLAAWLTAVFNLDAAHPITGAELTGAAKSAAWSFTVPVRRRSTSSRPGT